jgi:uncharacterized MnhB-related membrane protein
MSKSLLLFQGVIVLLMLFLAVFFIIEKSYLQSILYIAFGTVFLLYSMAGLKKKNE